jgi:hypothetical protein
MQLFILGLNEDGACLDGGVNGANLPLIYP